MSGLMVQMRPHVTIDEDGTWLPKDPVWGMYHDLDPEDQEEQKSLVMRNAFACTHGEVAYEAWRDVPSTHVRTTVDRWVPPVYQDICVAHAKDAGVHLAVKVFHCGNSAHVRMK
ncbi:hypothetical protein F4818DRAFT_359295 [Hypoxylon cercidicola]|nr:hypothetical protein F4818DRAFT_359295 [Hypoxylon cercidicola]